MTRTKAGGASTEKLTASRRTRGAAKRDRDAGARETDARDAAAKQHRGLLREMLRIRRFEERCVELYSSADIRGFVHLYIGEEAVAAGVMPALAPDDAVVSTYREHGHALARGIPADAVMAEMFGRSTGCSRGRGGSMHLFDARTRFYGGNAIVGGGLPIAVGLALADRMRGADRVTACFFGDGAVAEGEFHECLNLAALWHLPVLFVCENNRYAMGTALPREHAQTDLALRASSYGLVSWAVDGMDVLEVSAAAQRAVEAVRWGGGPHFLEMRTYRYRAHSMYDPDRYRDKAEIQEWKRHDPIEALTARLRADGELTNGDLSAMEEEIAAEVSGAVDAAKAAPFEPVEELTRFVYSEQGVRP
ncbi:MAG TPA: pyruvate dehydrogenase (acetyl-transferring) E1 component subunit alpha [Spirillospora sp.]|nr:pyruvate dehydrogenase (acetyl-transferring) E1 component subunit alpha [Spirillospora sp.]